MSKQEGFPSHVVQPKSKRRKKKRKPNDGKNRKPWYTQSSKSKKNKDQRRKLAEQYNGGLYGRAKSWSANTRLAPTPPPDDAYSP